MGRSMGATVSIWGDVHQERRACATNVQSESAAHLGVTTDAAPVQMEFQLFVVRTVRQARPKGRHTYATTAFR